jgi:hypothetical protein
VHFCAARMRSQFWLATGCLQQRLVYLLHHVETVISGVTIVVPFTSKVLVSVYKTTDKLVLIVQLQHRAGVGYRL